MDEIIKRDQNHVTVLAGVTDDADQNIAMLRVDPTTKRLLVSATGLPTGITIGDPINGGDPNEVLYSSPTTTLTSDNGFTREAGNNFQTTIQQSNGTGISGTFLGSGGAWTLRTDDSGPSGNQGRADINSSFVRMFQTAGTGEFGLAQVDSNQVDLQWNNNTGTLARTFGNVFGMTTEWTNGTIDALIQTTTTRARAQFDNGDGNVSNTIWNATKYESTFTDPNLYASKNGGSATEAYTTYETPYQIYSDENTTFQPGDTLTDDQGNTADVISDDGNGLILVNNINIVSPPVFGSGSTITDQLFQTATATANSGIYDAKISIAQNDTPSGDRYAGFYQTTSSSGVVDRFELKHPIQARFFTPSLIVDDGSSQGSISARTQYNINQSFFAKQDVSASNVFVGFGTPTGATGSGAERLTAIGNGAGSALTTGDDNTFVGDKAGNTITTGIENTMLGASSDGNNSARSGSIALGYNAMARADNQFALPDTVTSTQIRGNNYIWPVNAAAAPSVLRNDGATNLTWFDMNQGSYTPTVTNTTNITSTSPAVAFWYRIGNRVTVFGQILIDPTVTATFTSFEMDLPVASNFANSSECAGVGMSGTAQESFQVLAEVTNNTALIWFTPVNVTSQSYSYQFSYTVI